MVINESDSPITEISVEYNGGTIELPLLNPKSKENARIFPAGETDLTLKYRDISTKEVRIEKVDVYLEPGYMGKVEIKFDINGKVSSKVQIDWLVNPFH